MTTIEHIDELKKKTEIIAFSSGKGGTGKTLIATCLGYVLTKIGLRVLLVDTDTATDGLSLYLLGPSGIDKVNDIPYGSTFTGILMQYKEHGRFQFKPWKINRGMQEDHGVIYEAVISGTQIYGDRFENSEDDSNTRLDRESFRAVVQTMFETLRNRSEFDYVIVDTRGGFSAESIDVSALADSYIVVTEADVTSFYQNRNLIQYIDKAASEFSKRAVLRSIIVNKSTQFTSKTKDYDLDNLEASFRLQLEKEFPIDYRATHPLPLSFEALTVQKSHKLPIRHALDSDFSYAFLVAFHNILSVVTQPWKKEQVAEWNYLVESVNSAIQKRNEDLQRVEMEEQEQHKELEKLRKDHSDYVNRISFLERELKEIDERYKRELERSQLIVSKTVTKTRQNLMSGLVSIFTIAVLITIGMFGKSLFSVSPASTPTIAAMLPTETPLPTGNPTDTVPPGKPTRTAYPDTATPSPTNTVAITQADCSPIDPKFALSGNYAHFVADTTVLPGTSIPKGTTFVKTWTIRNVGNIPWTTNYTFVVADAPDFGNYDIQHFPSFVSPGQCIDLSITLTAPTASGTYKGTWILRDDANNRFFFDERNIVTLNVSIVVP